MSSEPPRPTVALLFGGKSGEHDVSIRSAATVYRALAKRYSLVPVYIDRAGQMASELPSLAQSDGVSWVEHLPEGKNGRHWVDVLREADVVFPMLHGPMGEDGTIQGLLESLDCAFVGAGVTGSALAMDKALTKAVLRDSGIPVVPDLLLTWERYHREPTRYHHDCAEQIGFPAFVKPCNMGSSVGVTKVSEPSELAEAIELAFRADRRVLVEEAIPARELEVAVLGNDKPEATLPGEVVPGADFYDYDDKYVHNTAKLLIPAPVEDHIKVRCQALAVEAFLKLDLQGMARVDFFLDGRNGDIYLNEINTLPGFTSISMFPKLWAHQGVAIEDLVHRLVSLGLSARRRHQWQDLMT